MPVQPKEIGSSRRFSTDPQSRKSDWRGVVLAIVILLLLASSALTFYYKDQAKEAKETLSNPEKVAQDEVNAVLEKVKLLMVLPEDEQPTLATVADPSKLQDQPFFANAEVGDRLLLYANAKKAILYSPRLNKIVEVAPLNIGEAAQ